MLPLAINRRLKRVRYGLAVRELLLIVAVLTVAFGLMVSLARQVRSEAAHSLVQRELLELEDALAAYRREFGQLPDVPPLVPPAQTAPGGGPSAAGVASAAAASAAASLTLTPGHEALLRGWADKQNRSLVFALNIGIGPDEITGRSTLGGVSAMLFDGSTLLDPWGRPIAYLPAGRPEIGTAAGDAPFFFSAGPDGLYLSREDNIYSYEVLAAGPADETGPTTSTPPEPDAGGDPPDDEDDG